MYEIDSKTYEKLYAKYLQGGRTKEMVDLAGDLKGKTVLDLCCGGGRLTREVLKRKPKRVFSTDESFSMIEDNFKIKDITIIGILSPPWDTDKFSCACGTVNYALSNLKTDSIDVIFCQQAINYWFNPEYAKIIHKVLAPYGLFIFNTFNKRPSPKPSVKEYELKFSDGNRVKEIYCYTEVSWLVGDTVKHIQIAQGMDPHFTEFRWITPEEFQEAFKKEDFKVTIKTEGSTDIYICRKV